jgi:hypothetical protein
MGLSKLLGVEDSAAVDRLANVTAVAASDHGSDQRLLQRVALVAGAVVVLTAGLALALAPTASHDTVHTQFQWPAVTVPQPR